MRLIAWRIPLRVPAELCWRLRTDMASGGGATVSVCGVIAGLED